MKVANSRTSFNRETVKYKDLCLAGPVIPTTFSGNLKPAERRASIGLETRLPLLNMQIYTQNQHKTNLIVFFHTL